MSRKPKIVAKVDPPLIMSSVFSAGECKTQNIHVKFEFDGAILTFVCFKRLNAFEQSVLFVLISSALEAHLTLTEDAETALGQELWTKLVARDQARMDTALAVQTTSYQLLKRLGMSLCQENYKLLTEALFSLSGVMCRVQKDKYDWSMHLLSYCSHEETGKLWVALNGSLAKAITGGQYISVPIDEYNSLGADADRLLYAYLCSFVRSKCSRSVSLDELVARIYSTECSPDAHRQRRSRVAAGLEKINDFHGWSITKTGRGTDALVSIKRF